VSVDTVSRDVRHNSYIVIESYNYLTIRAQKGAN